MTKIVIKDRRFTYNKDCRKAWKVIAEFNPSDFGALEVIPEVIKNHYERNKWKNTPHKCLQFAEFRGLDKYYAIKVHQLARANKIRLGVNRAGDICSYRIREGLKC